MSQRKIVVTGATGLIGTKLCLQLFRKGYQVAVLCRDPKKSAEKISMPYAFHEWNGRDSAPVQALEGAMAVVHLAGEPIGGHRWSETVKKSIRESRVVGTNALVEGIRQTKQKPRVLVGASAVGYYGDGGSENLTEQSLAGTDFLAGVCKEWESAYGDVVERTVLIRTALVLANEGGGLQQMLPPFRLGAGAKIGDGTQWMSWIHIDDIVQLYIFAIENSALRGPVNAAAPEAVRNSEFTKILTETLARPNLLVLPRFMLRLLYGEMATVVVASQKVIPTVAQAAGFQFQFAQLTGALENLLKPEGVTGAYVFESYQWLPRPRAQVFPFFADAKNLEVITPPWLHFKILKTSTPDIQQGTLIEYRLRIKGVPIFWRTEIETWEPDQRFVDRQLKGPYTIWHHTHSFESIGDAESKNGGTLMLDHVVYKVPFGVIGDLAALFMVISDVKTIFRYRREQITKFINEGRI